MPTAKTTAADFADAPPEWWAQRADALDSTGRDLALAIEAREEALALDEQELEAQREQLVRQHERQLEELDQRRADAVASIERDRARLDLIKTRRDEARKKAPVPTPPAA